MDNTNQNAEGTSVDRQEPDDTLTDTSKVMEEDFEILDIREAEEPELAGELDGQERAMEVGHCEAGGQERAVEVGRCEAGGEESAVEVGHSETSGQETASDRSESRQEIGGDTLGIVGQDNWEKRAHVYHVNFSRSGGQLEPCKLEFLRDRALKIDDEEVTLENMRYATRRPYKSFTQRAADCVILSYVGATRMVEHSFLEMPDVHDTLNLAQDFIKLLRNKYPENTDDKINEECLDTIYKQPLYFGDADVAVKDAKDKSIIYDGRCIVVLDIERLTIYPVTKEEVCGPPHRLMFWKEEGNDSVEKILHYSKDQKIAFETPAMIYELPVIGDIVQQLHELQPKAKGVLDDKALLRQWVTSTRRTKRTPTSASASLYPEIHQAHTAEARSRPAHEWENLPGASGWRDAQDEHYQRQEVEKTIVQELNRELNNAEISFASNEDMQMYWITVEGDLNAIIDSGCVHETDHCSGGLDPDNAEHLKRALNDIADQLSEQQLEIAVSRIQAARRVFEGSQNAEILRFFQATDMELLRKLYFRSLVQ